ncbi:MAG: 2Fe-2S iron-sulfur cluster-binding protein, partial [Terriglobales bacterium]
MSQYHSLPIAAVTAETRDAVTVTFAVPPELEAVFRFTQGQHVNVRARIEGAEVRRSYSICAEAGVDRLRILIKRQPEGLFSNWANDSLRAGQTLDVMPPSGLFHTPLDAARAGRYLAVAAGSGITPVLSLLKTTLRAEPHSQFTLVYGNRASSSILFREELADLKDRYLDRFSLVHVMTREHQDLDLLNGRLSAEKMEQLLRYWGPLAGMDAVFLCGPQLLNRELTDSFRAAGYSAARIKIEQFAANQQRQQAGAAGRPRAAATQTSREVRLILDGRQYRFPIERERETILEAGLRAGLDLRFSCKSGVCATCRAKLVSGEVDMDGNFALEDNEIARGYI